MIKRVDPGSKADFSSVDFLKDLKTEVKTEMTKDADLAKLKNQLGWF